MSSWFTEWNHLVFQRYIQFKSNYCNVEYSIPPPPTVPEDWGPRGHFHFKPYSPIWQTKKSSVRLGKATQCLRIGVQEDIFVSDHIHAQLGLDDIALSTLEVFGTARTKQKPGRTM